MARIRPIGEEGHGIHEPAGGKHKLSNNPIAFECLELANAVVDLHAYVAKSWSARQAISLLQLQKATS
jgi:hypothetical protein